MAEITLVAAPGRVSGSSESRRMRAAGRIPAVVYGHGMDAVAVSVDGRELRHALSGESGLNQLLSLDIAGQSHLALARELQRHPVRNTVVHVDFQVVRRDEVVSADVPIVLVGEARAVEMEQGMIEQLLTSLTVHAVPASIPNVIEIDISALAIGDTVRVGDLALPAEVSTDVDPEEAVVLAAASSVTVESEAEEAEAAEAGAEPGDAGRSPAEEG
ncbi:MAG: 50S ribosomal protein L25 [Acidimicrobiales bacterium]